MENFDNIEEIMLPEEKITPPKKTLYQKISDHLKRNYHLYASFILPMGILFIAYIMFEVYPFGENSLLSLDLNAQYIYYYDYMHDVFAGKESIFYSWSRNLSGEMMGIIGYYLASPFMLLLYMFPREMITEGLLTMMLAKAGACGLAMGLYLDKKKGYAKTTVIIFAISYALNSYFVVQTMNPMWLDSVIFLPIIAWAIESLCEKGKYKMLIFSLVYVFVTNFYIGYMMGIFAIIYYVYYICFKMNKSVEKNFFLKRSGLFAASGLISVLLSAFMLVPVVKSLSLGKFEFSEPDYSLAKNFNILETFGKLLPNSYDTVRMEGYPFVYTGTLALILVIMYVAHKNISTHEKIGSVSLLALMTIFMYIRPIDMIWHGGQMPNWLPYRYSFVISFLMVIMAAQVFENLKNITNKMIFGALGLIVLFSLYADTLENDKLDGPTVLLPAVLIAFVFALMLYWVKNSKIEGSIAFSLIMIVSIEAFYNTSYTLDKMDADIVYSTRPSYNDFIQPTRKIIDKIYENDESFFRAEKTFHRTVNDPMALRLYGMSHSSSTLNSKAISFLKYFGYTSRSHYSRYDGATPLTDDLFGVKYVLAKDDKKHITSEYESIYDIKDNANETITAYKNLNALPMLYLSSEEVADITLSDTNPFDNQNALISAIIGDGNYYEVFKKIDGAYPTYENVIAGRTTDNHDSYKVEVSGENAQIEYNLIAPADAGVYMYLDTAYERRLNVWVNTEWAGNYYEYEDYNIKALGEFEKDESIDVILTLTKDDLYIRNAYFYYLDEQLLNELVAKIQENNSATQVEKLSGTSLKINANAKEESLLFSTIPSQQGWTVYVDGEKQEYLSILDESVIAIPLSKGEHTIELKFFPDGLAVGLAMSFAGVVFLIILLFSDKILFKIKQLDKISEKSKEINSDDDANT